MQDDPGRWYTDKAQGIHEGEQQHAAAIETLRAEGGRHGFVLFTKDEEGVLTVHAYMKDAGHPAQLARWATFIYEYSELLAERVGAVMISRLARLLMEDLEADDNDV